MDSNQRNSGPLVEHFFRHESANLVVVLTRAFGIARLDLVEDMVQSAMIEAMQTWRHRGVPENPTAWIHRVARNRILDELRREKIHQKALALSGHSERESESLMDHWLTENQLPDSLLRMMFVCCHPSLARGSQIALTLRVLCGFSINEISRGLLVPSETVKKRIQRAKKSLAEQQVSLETISEGELFKRLDAVHSVLYLMFNEGYSTSSGIEPIRDDICEEAARLCHMLCQHDELKSPTSFALLALMLFHAARLDSRTDKNGVPVLLEYQDRGAWDQRMITMAQVWLGRSEVEHPTRYHLEAGIAMLHCRAKSVEQTNWPSIVRLCDRLIELQDSPLYRMNRAIALGQSGDVSTGLEQLISLQKHREMKDYFLLYCAIANLQKLAGENDMAADSLRTALAFNMAAHERELVQKRLEQLSNR